jgi:hypothetical protein
MPNLASPTTLHARPVQDLPASVAIRGGKPHKNEITNTAAVNSQNAEPAGTASLKQRHSGPQTVAIHRLTTLLLPASGGREPGDIPEIHHA